MASSLGPGVRSRRVRKDKLADKGMWSPGTRLGKPPRHEPPKIGCECPRSPLQSWSAAESVRLGVSGGAQMQPCAFRGSSREGPAAARGQVGPCDPTSLRLPSLLREQSRCSQNIFLNCHCSNSALPPNFLMKIFKYAKSRDDFTVNAHCPTPNTPFHRLLALSLAGPRLHPELVADMS